MNESKVMVVKSKKKKKINVKWLKEACESGFGAPLCCRLFLWTKMRWEKSRVANARRKGKKSFFQPERKLIFRWSIKSFLNRSDAFCSYAKTFSICNMVLKISSYSFDFFYIWKPKKLDFIEHSHFNDDGPDIRIGA